MSTPLYTQFKVWLMAHTHLAQDALHVYVGLLVLVGACMLLRRPLGSLLPLLLVLAAALAGEALDMRIELAKAGQWNWRESVHDVLNTMFWPVLLALLARLRWLRTPPPPP